MLNAVPQIPVKRAPQVVCCVSWAGCSYPDAAVGLTVSSWCYNGVSPSSFQARNSLTHLSP